MSYSAAALIWGVVLLSYLVFVGLAIGGLLSGCGSLRCKGLILAMAAGGMALSAVTISMSRLHLPALAFLLPAAATGLVNLGRPRSAVRLALTAAIFLLFLVFILPTFRVVVEQHLRPSSHYSGLVGPIARALGSRTEFVDQVILRSGDAGSSDTLTVAVSPDEYRFHGSGSQVHLWERSPDSRRLELNIVSRNPTLPLGLTLQSEKLGRSHVIRPIDKYHFRTWRPAGLSNTEYMWFGGGSPPREEQEGGD
jgi:hypothetical protein